MLRANRAAIASSGFVTLAAEIYTPYVHSMSFEKAVEAKPKAHDTGTLFDMRIIRMRDIKFRLFGKNSKEFLRPENVGLNLKELQNVCDIDLWHVMQYTGLRGLGGTDVYEGDIVRFDVIKGNLDHDQYERDQVGEVRIAPNGVSFGGWRYGWVCNIEVIGNIHQNPELLEGDK